MQTAFRGKLRQLWTITLLVLFTNLSSLPSSQASPENANAVAQGSKASTADQEHKAAESLKSEKNKEKKGHKELLWKLTSDKGATLYLLGTIHLFKPENYPLPEEMEKAFAKADALIVEVDITKSDPESTNLFVKKRGIYPPADDLSKHITANGNKLLQEYCLKRNIPFANLARMKPWLVAITVLQLEMTMLGFDSKSGIDLHFLNQANKLGKKTISLETAGFQLNLFANLPDDLQEKDLDLALVDLDKLQSDAGEMMKAWKEGDDKALDDLITKDVKEHPELAPVQEKILYERNVTMAQKLDGCLQSGTGTYLVAIGSAHLVGNRSVIQLLKQRGYKVSQIVAGDKI